MTLEKLKYGRLGIVLRRLYHDLILDDLYTSTDAALKHLGIELKELEKLKKYYHCEKSKLETILEEKIKEKEIIMEGCDNEEKLIYKIPILGTLADFRDSLKYEKTAVEQELLEEILASLKVYQNLTAQEILKQKEEEIRKEIKYYMTE